MIKYSGNTINDWYFDSDNIIKVYRNNAICYYKLITSGSTPEYQVCYAVVDDISQYTDTEFVDVYDKATEKWYKLNNLNQYEEYGVYGDSIASGSTTYQGKLAIVDGYEYQYSGSSWVNVGEVSGSTASLPDVAFSVNFNANNYDANTQTLTKTSGQLVDTDAVITAGTPTVNNGYLTIAAGTRATISGYQTYFNRDNSNPNLTIISKQRTDGTNCHMFANRADNYNWMYRPYATKLTLHGGSETGGIAVTTQPVIESVRVDSNRNINYNNYTNNTSSGTTNFQYGSTNSCCVALFQGYAIATGEYFVGDFYWVYMSQNTLTDDQVQQVIDYNEGNGGEPTYPLYYDEKSGPLDNLTFSSMTEANEYAYNNCVYDGLKATIDGTRYIFSGDSQGGYEWVEQTSPIPSEYTELQYFTVPKVASNTSNRFEIENELQPNYIYTYEFTPISGFYDSYYGLVTTDDGDAMFKYYGIFKLDNGWGTEFYRNILAFYNYKFSTQSSGNISGAFRYYIDTKATVITKLHNSSDVSQGADLIVENEGYSTYSGVSTTKVDSSWTPVNGVYNMPLFCTNRSFNAYTPNLNFHNFKVEDTQGNLVYDYRPVIRVSDSKVGLFDIVNQQFYYPTFLTLVAGPSA